MALARASEPEEPELRFTGSGQCHPTPPQTRRILKLSCNKALVVREVTNARDNKVLVVREATNARDNKVLVVREATNARDN